MGFKIFGNVMLKLLIFSKISELKIQYEDTNRLPTDSRETCALSEDLTLLINLLYNFFFQFHKFALQFFFFNLQ